MMWLCSGIGRWRNSLFRKVRFLGIPLLPSFLILKSILIVWTRESDSAMSMKNIYLSVTFDLSVVMYVLPEANMINGGQVFTSMALGSRC
jgi:hypothetical protein